MDIIGEFAKRLLAQLAPLTDWLMSNWAITMILFVLLLYGAGKHRRLYRSHH